MLDHIVNDAMKISIGDSNIGKVKMEILIFLLNIIVWFIIYTATFN